MPYDSEIKVEVKTTSVPPRKLGRPATAVSPKKTLLGSQSKHSISASGMSYIDSDEFIQDIKVIKGYRNIAKPLTDIFLAVEMVILNKPMGELMSWPRFQKLCNNPRQLRADVKKIPDALKAQRKLVKAVSDRIAPYTVKQMKNFSKAAAEL